MNLPERHPRERVVDKARCELVEHLYRHSPRRAHESLAAYVVMIQYCLDESSESPESYPNPLAQFLASWRIRHHLTVGEIMLILGQGIADDAKYIIRYERHGRFDKPGGIEQ